MLLIKAEIFKEQEDWDRAIIYYEKAFSESENGSVAAILSILEIHLISESYLKAIEWGEKAMNQRSKIDSGKINIGETINFGYITQGGLSIDEDTRVITVLKDIAEFIVMSDKRKVSASQLLEHFMFTPEMQFTEVKRLSGGEKRRASC